MGGGLQQFCSYWYNRPYGFGLKEKFPYTLSLGSSEVNLPIHAGVTLDKTIVITKSYHEIYYRILDAGRAGKGGVVLTGQPGVGASKRLDPRPVQRLTFVQEKLSSSISCSLGYFQPNRSWPC